MIDRRDPSRTGALVGEDRRRSDRDRRGESWWNRQRRRWRRTTSKFLWLAATAAVAMLVDRAFGITKTFIQLPGAVEELTAQVAELKPKVSAALAVSDTVKRGQSIQISWQCLDYAQTDTTRFRQSLLACGEAFHQSRMDPDAWAHLLRTRGQR